MEVEEGHTYGRTMNIIITITLEEHGPTRTACVHSEILWVWQVCSIHLRQAVLYGLPQGRLQGGWSL